MPKEMKEILDVRPSEIIRLYFSELLVIEENAKFLDPVYFWEVEQ